MHRPFFSIITCTKNSAGFLLENISSVNEQTFKSWEHVFIDGYSSDGTLKIINNYRKGKCNVRLFSYPPRGVADAFNKGITHSRGEWVIFLNSDDKFYDREVLERVYSFVAERSELEFVYGKSLFVNKLDLGRKKTRIVPHRFVYRRLGFWLLLLTNYVPHQSVFIRRDIFAKYGNFDERFVCAMDYEMWVRLARSDIKAGFLNSLLSECRIRKSSVSVTSSLLGEYIYVIKKYVGNPILASVLVFLHGLNNRRPFF